MVCLLPECTLVTLIGGALGVSSSMYLIKELSPKQMVLPLSTSALTWCLLFNLILMCGLFGLIINGLRQLRCDVVVICSCIIYCWNHCLWYGELMCLCSEYIGMWVRVCIIVLLLALLPVLVVCEIASCVFVFDWDP